jgi:ABC-type polysaccharide/polyol phosphate export permease
VDQANLITKTVFPSEIIPVSVFLSALAGHLLALTLMIAATGVLANHISIYLVFLPFYIFVIGLLAIGVGWIVASLNVFLRDTAQAVSVVMTFWFWMTPIFISEDRYPNRAIARWMLAANPLTYLVRAYRAMLIDSIAPSATDFAIAMAYGCAVFVAGGLFFRHMKRGFADVL